MLQLINKFYKCTKITKCLGSLNYINSEQSNSKRKFSTLRYLSVRPLVAKGFPYTLPYRSFISKPPSNKALMHNTLFFCILLIPYTIFIIKSYFLIKVFAFLFLQIISILILYYLKNRWYKHYKVDLHNYNKVITPIFLFISSIAVIYPIFCIILCTLLRYLRLGSTYNIIGMLSANSDHILFLLFIIPFILYRIKSILNLLQDIKIYLWSYTEFLFYKIHLYLLQYYDYYKICAFIHKLHFLIFDLLFQYPGAYYRLFSDKEKLPFFVKATKIIQYIYYHIYLLHTLVICCLVIELILYNGHLFYGIYLCFYYPIIISILWSYNLIGGQDLVKNMCMSDYLYQNFIHPRHPLKFWFLAKNPTLWYKFAYTLDPSLQKIYEEKVLLERAAYLHFIRLHPKLLYRVHGYMPIKTSVNKTTYPRVYAIRRGHSHPWTVRLAAYYKTQYGVRWFHTTRVLYGPEKNLLHPFTAKFLKDPYAILSLLNKPGQHLDSIQRLSKHIKNWPKAEDLYKNSPNILIDQSKTLTNVLEINFVQRFRTLAEKDVIIGTFYAMKKRFGYDMLETMQMRPDLVSMWIENKSFEYKGYLAVDEKYNINPETVHYGRQLAINNIDLDTYVELLNSFENTLVKKQKLTEEMRLALSELKDIAQHKNFEDLLQVWSKNLHLFPRNWKPPLVVDKTFDESNLHLDALQLIRRGEATAQKISDKLYVLFPSTETGSFDEKALDNFDGSFLQEILS